MDSNEDRGGGDDWRKGSDSERLKAVAAGEQGVVVVVGWREIIDEDGGHFDDGGFGGSSGQRTDGLV